MSHQEDLAAVQSRLDELVRRVGELEQTVDRLRASGPVTPAPSRAATARTELVTIPDAPYDNALWTDSDDEGLGVRDRHAP
ncbi:hypothetical protein [Streptomyces peucetius]|uniref:Uncharacterized protein n=1 Tax=Streptomyces peucetius TaxID=1950 RepID=A0ABY6IB09_STRPE|nr:hypothetical protein [Streptomyces peucetius]UYQ64197.1 hypothetical protein OGH68_23855 [Streptomyces peucetius]